MTLCKHAKLEDTAGGHMSHAEIVGRIGMLLRTDDSFMAVTTAARDRIAWLADALEAAERERDAGREWMRVAWHEFNAIRARDGAPEGVSHEWWEEITEALGDMLGEDRVPWRTKAAETLLRPYKTARDEADRRAEAAEQKVADIEDDYLRRHKDAVDRMERIVELEGRIEAAEARAARLEAALEFYADPETYFALLIVGDPPCGEFIEDFEETEGVDGPTVKPGKRARAALTPTKETDNADD